MLYLLDYVFRVYDYLVYTGMDTNHENHNC